MAAPHGLNAPPALNFMAKLHKHLTRDVCYRAGMLGLTFMAYACYHLSRKPISVVKNVLHQNCSTLQPPANVTDKNGTWCDWAPFDGSDASQLLGTLDSAFLFAYAVAMFASGFIAERVNLRNFVALGMILSGIFSCLFGIAKWYNIHSMAYFVVVQIFAGIFQTTGWPGVVTVVGNWFGKGRRGLIFGVWNSHTSIGNILGTLVAAEYVESDWSLSFIAPGLIIAAGGVIIWLFLAPSPADVGCSTPEYASRPKKARPYRRLDSKVANRSASDDEASSSSSSSSATEDTEIVTGDQFVQEVQQRRATEATPILRHPHVLPSGERAIGFLDAYRIPGVLEFSLSLFFAKLVSYTFLYWLPLYIKASTTLSPSDSANISTLFDLGGIFGGIVAGIISDAIGMSATTCSAMLTAAIPMMFIYEKYAAAGSIAMVLLIMVGFLVNGPYALITTAVSAELGTRSTALGGNSRALATVTAIIDGTGSIGAAVGPLLAGFVSSNGWQDVFYMLMAADLLALLLLSRLIARELGDWRRRRRGFRTE